MLRRRKPVTVAALGGSISAGSSYTVRQTDDLYHSRVAAALQRLGPPGANLSITDHNGALPATGPSFFEHCLESQLPAAPHLILVEFTVNLDHNPAAFERMLRKLLTLPRRPAVVVVSMHGWRLTDSRGRRVSPWRCAFPRAGGKADVRLRGSDQQWEDQDPRGDEDRVAELCRYYDVPLVSMRAALLEPVRRGAVRLDEFMVDCRHPKAQGHLAMARAVLDRLLRTRPLAEGAACPASPAGSHPPVLPPPRLRDGLPMPNSMCARGELLRQRVLDSRGFDFSLEQRGKPGLVGLQPHSTLRLALDTEARQAEAEAPRRGRRGAGDGGSGGRLAAIVRPSSSGGGRRPTATLPDPKCSDHDVGEAAHNGQSQACAQQQPWCHSRKVFKRCPLTCGLCSRVRGGANATTSVLWLAYLSSYQHMGRALVRCSGGCECGPVEIDAHVRSERVSVTAVQRLAVVHTAAHGGPACALDLRILPTSSSGEHKWKLLGLLLGGNLAGDAWMPPGSIRYDGDTRSFFFPGADEKLPTQTSFGR